MQDHLTSFPSAGYISATTNGGAYMSACVGSGFGTVDLQALAPDGSTWLALPTAVHFTANGTVGPTYLPPGQYRVAIATTPAVYQRRRRTT
jgi:glutamine amidotransferase-like uncharacterized protein